MSISISPGMVERGEIVLINAKGQPPAAIASAVYAAMEEMRAVEEARRKNPGHEKPVYVHQEWPKWIDNPNVKGGGKVFQSAAEVPADWGKEDEPKPKKRAA